MFVKHGRTLALLFAALLFPLTGAAKPGGGPPGHARGKGKGHAGKGKGKAGKGNPGKHAEKRAEKLEKRAGKLEKRAEKLGERADKAEDRAAKRAAKAGGGRPPHAGQRGRPAHAGSRGALHPRGKANGKRGQANGKRDKAKGGRGKRIVGKDKMGKETRKHLKRIAQVERIEGIAVRTNNENLKAKAAMIREKEMQRHARAVARIQGAPAPSVETPPAQPVSLPSKTPTLSPTPKLDPMPKKDAK